MLSCWQRNFSPETEPQFPPVRTKALLSWPSHTSRLFRLPPHTVLDIRDSWKNPRDWWPSLFLSFFPSTFPYLTSLATPSSESLSLFYIASGHDRGKTETKSTVNFSSAVSNVWRFKPGNRWTTSEPFALNNVSSPEKYRLNYRHTPPLPDSSDDMSPVHNSLPRT